MKSNDAHQAKNFLITIHHQEHHSYQGTIQWLDTNKVLHFRSERELLNLLHEATDHQSELSLRSWGDSCNTDAI